MSRAARGSLLAGLTGLLLVGGGLFLYRGGTDLYQSRTDSVSSAIFATRLPDLNGRVQPISQWRGRVIVLNFWATWCVPCRTEVPELVRTQNAYRHRKVTVIGLAVDERQKVAAFAREFGINYPLLIGGLDALDLAQKAGDQAQALPFTVILDQQGRVAATHLGALTEAKLAVMLAPILKEGE